MFDDGEVLQGLDEPWTFFGANAMEWCVGLVVFLLVGSFARTPVSAMPMMMVGWITTTYTLASTRKIYPDEQRGVRNAVMSACGFPPPGIPAPSALQPFWSQAPVRELSSESKFVKIGLDKMFPSFQQALMDNEY